MKRSALTAFLCLFAIPMFCQTLAGDTGASGSFFFKPGKFDYGVNLGSEFTSFSGFGSALSTQVAPHFYYNVNKRFRLGGGISVGTTHYMNARSWYQNEQSSPSNGYFTNATLFISGQYLVNDRLTISGSAFKIFPVTKDPLPYNPFNPVSRNGAQGVNFNVDYKVGEHMHIQAGFRYSQGLNPYGINSYNNDPFRQGSYLPGIGTGNPGW